MKFLSVLEEVLRVVAIFAILLIAFVKLMFIVSGGPHEPYSSKPKKKHNWMAGFVLPPPSTEMDILARERAQRARAIWDGNNGYRIPKQ